MSRDRQQGAAATADHAVAALSAAAQQWADARDRGAPQEDIDRLLDRCQLLDAGAGRALDVLTWVGVRLAVPGGDPTVMRLARRGLGEIDLRALDLAVEEASHAD